MQAVQVPMDGVMEVVEGEAPKKFTRNVHGSFQAEIFPFSSVCSLLCGIMHYPCLVYGNMGCIVFHLWRAERKIR